MFQETIAASFATLTSLARTKLSYYATNIGGKPAKDSKSWFNDLTTDLVSVTVTYSKK